MPKNLKKRIEKYLQQQPDFIWLTSPYNTQSGRSGRRAPVEKGASSSSPGSRHIQGSEQGYIYGQVGMEGNHQALYRGNSYEGEQHSFEERVVNTTFPGDLHEHDFEEYVDRKFSNLNVSIRGMMKSLFKERKNTDAEQRVQLTDETDGSLAITLVQMLLDKDRESNELNVSVGYVKFLAKSRHSRDQLEQDWQINRDRIVKALEYKYGLNLKGELE